MLPDLTEDIGLQVVASVSSSLSVAGCIFTMVKYARMSDADRRTSNNCLVVVLALFDFMLCLCFLVGDGVAHMTSLCQVQGYCIQFFGLGSIVVTCALAWNMYQYVCRGSGEKRLRRFLKAYLALAFLFPALSCCILASLDQSVGSAEVWCWVSDATHQFLLFFLFVALGWYVQWRCSGVRICTVDRYRVPRLPATWLTCSMKLLEGRMWCSLAGPWGEG